MVGGAFGIFSKLESDALRVSQFQCESFQYQGRLKGVQVDKVGHLEKDGWLDIEKFQIILNNLLSNALKYTPEIQKLKS